MKVFIPTVGQRVKLVADWTFPLYWEDRNDSLFTHLSIDRPERRTFYDNFEGGREAYLQPTLTRRKLRSSPATLPEGTVLTIDRIFIRKGMEDFDSITFVLNKPKGVKGPMVRFWARLDDVNAGPLHLVQEDPQGDQS